MRGRTAASDHTVAWFVQAGLGILLVIFLCVHLAVNHWVAPQGLLSYEDIIRYFNVPGIALMEFLFLLVVTTHCLMGIYSILLDLNLTPRLKTLFRWILIAIGFATVLYGFHLTWSLARLSML